MPRILGKTIATVEARMTSSRLPGKILKPLAGKPSLERLVERARRAKSVTDVVICTTVNAQDDAVVEWGKKAGVAVFRGSEDDVLLRVLEAAKHHKAETIVELTGDCPFADPDIIDELARFYGAHDVDYASNILVRTYPRGLDTQIFSTATLAKVDTLTQDPPDRENVSLYIYEHPQEFRLGCLTAPSELYGPQIRICVDRVEDYEVCATVYDALYPNNPRFTSRDVMDFLRANPDVAAKNAHIAQKAVR